MNSGRSLATPAQGPSNPPVSGINGESLKHYRLVVRLGHGRGTDVLLATREVTPLVTEPVVVKRLHERFSQDAQFVRRFTNEAQQLRRLDHPNIVKTLDAGVLDGRCCIAHEYLEGQPLRLLLRRASEAGGLPRELAVYVLICVLQGLHHAHEAIAADGRRARIIHGNVSSHAVFVTNDGGVKLTDFGIAGWHPGAGESSRGDSFYSAPEQDADGALVDSSTDIWSAGVVLWESLTGKNPFGDDHGSARVAPGAKRNVAAPSSVDAQIPAALDAIVARALAWDPGVRYQTAADMQGDLERWLASVPSGDARAVLGALMRRRFGNEVIEQRRLVAVLRGGDDPVPSSRSGQPLMASATPVNGSAEPSGPPTSRSPQRPASVPPPPPPLPPLTPPPISRPPPQSPSGSLPNLPPPPVGKAAAPLELKRARRKTSSATFRALELASQEEDEAPPSEEEDASAPRARPFDYRFLIAVGAVCAAFSILVTSFVVLSLHARSPQPEAAATARDVPSPGPAAAVREQPAAEPQHEEAPIAAAQGEIANAAVATAATPPEPAPVVAGEVADVQHASAKRTAVTRAPVSPTAATEPSRPKAADAHAKADSPAAKGETAAPADPAAAPAPPVTTPVVVAESLPASGFLTVDTTPWSLVSENGKPLGQTPLVHVELAAGVHVLVLKNPELGLETSYTVTIQPGKTLVKRIGIE